MTVNTSPNKYVLLGGKGTGKSSIVSRLLYEEFDFSKLNRDLKLDIITDNSSNKLELFLTSLNETSIKSIIKENLKSNMEDVINGNETIPYSKFVKRMLISKDGKYNLSRFYLYNTHHKIDSLLRTFTKEFPIEIDKEKVSNCLKDDNKLTQFTDNIFKILSKDLEWSLKDLLWGQSFKNLLYTCRKNKGLEINIKYLSDSHNEVSFTLYDPKCEYNDFNIDEYLSEMKDYAFTKIPTYISLSSKDRSKVDDDLTYAFLGHIIGSIIPDKHYDRGLIPNFLSAMTIKGSLSINKFSHLVKHKGNFSLIDLPIIEFNDELSDRSDINNTLTNADKILFTIDVSTPTTNTDQFILNYLHQNNFLDKTILVFTKCDRIVDKEEKLDLQIHSLLNTLFIGFNKNPEILKYRTSLENSSVKLGDLSYTINDYNQIVKMINGKIQRFDLNPTFIDNFNNLFTIPNNNNDNTVKSISFE